MKTAERIIEKIDEKHLDMKDILAFVSATEINEATEKNAVLVTTHIRSCRKCLELVKVFQALYDELEDLDREDEFEQRAAELLGKEEERASSLSKNHFREQE